MDLEKKPVLNNMIFFMGVVEDRKDPKNLGRVRVRIYGDHDADKTKIPTASLPWAQVMMPVTSAACGGIGESATGIVQGSWVVGFYTDGQNRQAPLVMGTLVGMAGSDSLPDQGFSDPSGRHPLRSEGPDTSYSAIGGMYETTAPFIIKNDLRVERIETGAPAKVSSIVQDEPDAYYERQTWNMPHVALATTPSYPFNKVIETEGGHLFEIDDTPGNERFSRFHVSGTNEEFQQTGDKTLTVNGDNYTVVFGTDHIYVKGNANLTVDGDLRHLVKGNYHLEVNGNKTEVIRGTRQSKIGGSEHLEIDNDFASNVAGNYLQKTLLNETRLVDGTRNTTIGKTEDLTVTGETSITTMDKLNVFAQKDYSTTTVGKLTITSKGDIKLETPANMNTTVTTNVTNTIGGTLTDSVTGVVTENYSDAQNTTAGGDITITGGPNINLNP
tara:strand:- start:6412 stop:7737 length:1326 start_codon:yes stop_codon:yes gene_type:complete